MNKKSNPVVWFEIPVGDMQRGQRFYEHVFETRLSLHDFGSLKMAWFPGSPDDAGATGTLVQEEAYTPSHAGSMVYFRVDDINRVLDRAAEKGGEIITRKMSIGEHGYVGHFTDSEGNRIGLHSK